MRGIDTPGNEIGFGLVHEDSDIFILVSHTLIHRRKSNSGRTTGP